MEEFSKIKFHIAADSAELCNHHTQCKHVTKWLGRTGTTPKHTDQFTPLPFHPTYDKNCVGCMVEAWAQIQLRLLKEKTEQLTISKAQVALLEQDVASKSFLQTVVGNNYEPLPQLSKD